MKKTRKIYSIIERGMVNSFGAQRKIAWKSDRWIAYHLGKSWNSSRLTHQKVFITNIDSQTVSTVSATRFLSTFRKKSRSI